MKPSVLPSDLNLIGAAPPSSLQLFLSTFCRNKGAVLGFLVLALMVIIAILAPALAPHDPYALFTGQEQLPPAFLSGGDSRFLDRKSTRLHSSHVSNSYAVFCLQQKSE